MTTPSHRCVRGPRCAAAERTDADTSLVGAGTPEPDTLCEHCAARVRRACEHLPRDYVELEMIIDQRTRAREKVSGTPELPVPPRLDVLVTQASIAAELGIWAPPVAQELRIDWDDSPLAGRRPGPHLARAARLLALHHQLLLRLAPRPVLCWITPVAGPIWSMRTGLDGALALLGLHQRARLLVTGGAGDARLPVPCPSCQGVLIRRNGLNHVDCLGCPRSWPESDYQRLCLVLAEDFGAVAA